MHVRGECLVVAIMDLVFGSNSKLVMATVCRVMKYECASDPLEPSPLGRLHTTDTFDLDRKERRMPIFVYLDYSLERRSQRLQKLKSQQLEPRNVHYILYNFPHKTSDWPLTLANGHGYVLIDVDDEHKNWVGRVVAILLGVFMQSRGLLFDMQGLLEFIDTGVYDVKFKLQQQSWYFIQVPTLVKALKNTAASLPDINGNSDDFEIVSCKYC